MTQGNGPTRGGEQNPAVRLVGRDEGAAAIRSGQAIGRRPEPTVTRPEPSSTGGVAGVPRFPLPPSESPISVVAVTDGGEPPRPGDDGDSPALFPSPASGASTGDVTAPASTRSGAGGPTESSWEEISEEVDEASIDDVIGSVDDVDDTAEEEMADDGETMQGTRFRSDLDGSAGDAEAPQAPDARGMNAAVFTSASLKVRVATGLVFAGAALAAFAAGAAWVLALTTVVLLLASIELFDALRRVGFRPATLLALVAVPGTVLAAYARGESAIPLLVVLTATFTFLWYLTGVSKAAPTPNIAVTILGYTWVGVFGAFAGLLLRMPDDRGLAFISGAVLMTAAYDTVAYLGGSMFGRHPLAPSISPGKTWEGLAAGTIAALAMGGLVVQAISPWGVASGLALAAVVAVVAPVGDLVESMIKRDLKLKDMGRILPGHGGVLDRFDALLFVLPATYFLVRALGLG